MSFSGKTVVIVGASSGIGRELAILYARAGCRIGISARRADLLDELKKLFPAQIETAAFDVMDDDNTHQLDLLVQKLGGMDIFIYNAGYGQVSDDLDPVIEQVTVRTNVNGFVSLVDHAFNYFREKGSGQIAATSSIAALAGNHFAPAYSASKAFMSNYLEGLYLKAKRLKLRIAVTDIQPGFVKTKVAQGPNRFWEATPAKAARQMMRAIEAKKFRVYITRRWWLIVQLIKILPGWLYRAVA